MRSRKCSSVPWAAGILVALVFLGQGVSAAVISIGNGEITGSGGSTSLNLMLDAAPTGLTGYSINVTIGDPSIARITNVSFPEWALLTDVTPSLPGSAFRLKATDLNSQVQEGATNITLATLLVQGLQEGETPVILTLNLMNDENDNVIRPSLLPGMLSVHGQGVSPSAPGSPPVTPLPTLTEEEAGGTGAGMTPSLPGSGVSAPESGSPSLTPLPSLMEGSAGETGSGMTPSLPGSGASALESGSPSLTPLPTLTEGGAGETGMELTPSIPGTLPTTGSLMRSPLQGEGMEGTNSIHQVDTPTTAVPLTAKNGFSYPPWLVPVLLVTLLSAGIAAYYLSGRKRR